MSVLYLQPSKIRYSQDSINNYFDSKSSHSHTRIGETLDDLCEGRCRIDDIQKISVVKKNGKWFTADNRRLWIFKHLERLAKCTEIEVYECSYIPDHTFTTLNDGESVIVRRNPGGRWYCKPTPMFSDHASTKTGLSERNTKLENPHPSRLIQDRVNTQNAVEFKPLSKPLSIGDIHITAKWGINTATEEQEVQEPRFQMYKTFGHSVHTKSNLISPDRYPHIQYAPMIQTFADDNGTDVDEQVEELEVQVPDESKLLPMATRSRGVKYESRNPDCCWCMIL